MTKKLSEEIAFATKIFNEGRDYERNKTIEKIDIKIRNVENEQPEYWRGYLDALRELKQSLKE